MASSAALRLLAVSALLLLCAPTTSAATPGQLVDFVKRATQQGQALQGPAQSVNLINGPLIIIGQGPFPQIIRGFTEMITELTSSIAAAEGSKPLSGSEAQAVVDAVREMVRVHQVTLNILTGKAGLFSTVPFIGGPIASVLKSYEAVIDAFVFQLVDLAPTDAAKSITQQKDSLDATADTAIKAYEGLVPSFWQ